MVSGREGGVSQAVIMKFYQGGQDSPKSSLNLAFQFSVPEAGNSNIALFQISRFRNTELKCQIQ